MKIDYVPISSITGRRGKYPWRSLKTIGDYFDIPNGTSRGIHNAAYQQTIQTGRHFRTFKLEDGSRRVMLVEIEEGALDP